MKPGTAAFLFEHAADAANEPQLTDLQTGASTRSNSLFLKLHYDRAAQLPDAGQQLDR